MPQNMDKLRSMITVDDERNSLPVSRFLTPGTYTLNADGSITINGSGGSGAFNSLQLTGVITPAQLPDMTTEDWDIGSLADISRIRVDSAGNNAAIGGLVGGIANQVFIFTNVGAFDVTLLDQSAGSAAGNLFMLNGDKIIPPGGSYAVIYDGGLAAFSGWGA